MENTHLIFSLSSIKTHIDIYKKRRIIWLHNITNDQITLLKKCTTLFWSKSQKTWYINDNRRNREIFDIGITLVGKKSMEKISEINHTQLIRFQETLVLKGFSQNTIRTYCSEFATFLHLLKDFPAEKISAKKLRSYMLYCHTELLLSENQIHSRMNALKFYYEKVLLREKMFFEIPRPKKPQLLPKSLNQSEIRKILSVTENLKHRLIIELCYGMGLRVSEIVRLKLEDIDSDKMKVFVERSKGKKDRYVNLPQQTLQNLRNYYKQYTPKKFLFEGEPYLSYSTRSVQNVFKTAMKKAGIHKNIGIHSLRHSYATHLLEYGTDISLIQKLLGHNDIKTTLIYTHVVDQDLAKVQSPLDQLQS